MSQPCSRRLTGPEVKSSRLCLGEGHVLKLLIFFVGTVNPLVDIGNETGFCVAVVVYILQGCECKSHWICCSG